MVPVSPGIVLTLNNQVHHGCLVCTNLPRKQKCSNFAGARGASLPRPRDRQRHTTTAAETAAAAELARGRSAVLTSPTAFAHHARRRRIHPASRPRLPAMSLARLLELTSWTQRAATAPMRCECDQHAICMRGDGRRTCILVARPRECAWTQDSGPGSN